MTTVCLASKCLPAKPGLGGHVWVYLNWALGLRRAGCNVRFLETVTPGAREADTTERVTFLRNLLLSVGLDPWISLLAFDTSRGCYTPDRGAVVDGTRPFEETTAGADLLVDMLYDLPPPILGSFPRTALLDIDPGLLQVWMDGGQLAVERHDVYFSIGETVGRDDSGIPRCGVAWQYTPPAVDVECWPVVRSVEPSAPYTTVSGWWGDWVLHRGEIFNNEKRTSFLRYQELPRHTTAHLELTLYLEGNTDTDRPALEASGWGVRRSQDVCPTPAAYRAYVQASRGEFSCAKPSCLRFQNAWISDRTLCYLASGRPAVVEHTGPSRFLPDDSGMFRFRNMEEAVRAFRVIEGDYERQASAARDLVQEHFAAGPVARRVLERAL